MKENCPWCQSKNVYLMAAGEWELVYHCGNCNADFKIENTEYQFEKQERIEKDA